MSIETSHNPWLVRLSNGETFTVKRSGNVFVVTHKGVVYHYGDFGFMTTCMSIKLGGTIISYEPSDLGTIRSAQ